MQDIYWVIIDILLFNCLALIPFIYIKASGNNIKFRITNSHVKYQLYVVAIVLYCMIDRTGGDYFHYREIVEGIHSDNYWGTHLEYPYILLSKYIGFSYTLWRGIVWGLALLFYLKIINLLNFPKFLSVWIFVLVGLTDFSIVRSSLALTVFIYGSIVVKTSRSLFSSVRGILLIVLSLLFHKSTVILLPYLIFIYVPINIYSVIIICSLLFGVQYFINNNPFIFYYLFESSKSAQDYVTSNEVDIGLAELIQKSLFWIPSLLLICKGLKEQMLFNRDLISLEYKLIFYSILLIVTLSLIPFNTYAITDRILWMLGIPVALLFIDNIKKYGFSKYTICILIMFFIYNEYKLSYLFYLKGLGLAI